MFEAGDTIGQYQVITKIKDGGMAALYLGERTMPNGMRKLSAIKVVHPHLARDERFKKMFIDEAVLSSRIQHPNVVHVEELGEVDDSYFLVMEYVQGCSLSQLLRALAIQRRRMRPELATKIAMAVADGLHAAHEARGLDGELLGAVHRDVTPENILITKDGQIKVIDFGVAKSRDRVAATTAGGMIKGKFSYMAPEQARNEELDRRTDIYQLGIVTWEMLTMRRCFKGEMSRQFLETLRNPKVKPPKEFVRSLSDELSDTVMRALEPDISARIETASAYKRLLAKAEPAAARVTDTQLADLLGAMLGAELEQSARIIPPQVAVQEPEAHPFNEEQVLKTLTIEGSGLSTGQDLLSSGARDLAANALSGRPSAPPARSAPDSLRAQSAFGTNPPPGPFDDDDEYVDEFGDEEVDDAATVMAQPDLSIFSANELTPTPASEAIPLSKRPQNLPVGALFADPPTRPLDGKPIAPALQYRGEQSTLSRIGEFLADHKIAIMAGLIVLAILYWVLG